jgi:hypothetical protein
VGFEPPASGPSESLSSSATTEGPSAPYGSPASAPPASFPELTRIVRSAAERRRSRSGGNLLLVAFFVHLLAIGVSLVFLKAIVESSAHRSVSWDELFAAARTTGVMGLLVAGIVGQVFFSIIALGGSVLLYSQKTIAVGPMIAFGVFAVLFSVLIFGGFVGAIGGGLSIAGGAVAWPRPAPRFYPYPLPPRYPMPPGGFPP